VGRCVLIKHVHSTVTHSSRFHCLIDVINKPTTVELCISPVYRRLAVARSGAKCTNLGSLGHLGVTQGHRQCHHSIERIRLPIRL